MRRYYTVLRNVCAQKSPCRIAERSELPCKSQPLETVAEKYSPSDVSHHFCSPIKRYLQWPHWKPTVDTVDRLFARAATKKKDDAIKRLRTWLTSSHWSDQSTSDSQQTSLILVDHGVKFRPTILTYCYHSSWCQVISSYFSRTSPRRTRHFANQLFCS